MREILFRGKRYDTGEWLEGNLLLTPKGMAIIKPSRVLFDGGYLLINPETVGQFTGLRDMHGKKIFEGDIVRYTNNVNEIKQFSIVWYLTGWWCRNNSGNYPLHDFRTTRLEVIGNIHDNPELLKEGEQE